VTVEDVFRGAEQRLAPVIREHDLVRMGLQQLQVLVGPVALDP